MKHSDYLKKKKTRETRKKIISIISAIVVFITTYALVLPAITLDVSKASQEPGIAYEQMQFRATAAAASVTAADSTEEEAQVEEPAAEEPEEEPAEEIKEEEPAETPEEEVSAVSDEEEEEEEPEEEAPAEPEKEEAPEVQEDKSEADSADEKTSEPAPEKAEDADTEKAAEDTAVDQSGTAVTDAAAAATTAETAAEFKIPELDALDFDDILTSETNFYYYHPENAEEAEDLSSDAIDDWKKVGSDTVLAPEDFVRVYLSYEIPAGALNETNAVARYKLPAGLELSDKQIKAINKYENGIAASKSGSDQDKYLGAEAIEGSRTPDEKADDEYIAATVKVKKTDNDRQELVFTFIPYTIEKNHISYDEKGEVTSKGEKVKGFFTFDLIASQIAFDTVVKDDSADEEIQYSEATFVFADKDRYKIERTLTMSAAEESEEEAIQEPKILTSAGSDYTVTISYTADAQIPENAKLAVREIEKNTDEYASYLEQAKGAVDDETKSVNEARFFDITILANDQKVEPLAPVNVQITFAGIEQTNTDDTQLLHYKDSEEIEVMNQAEFSKSEEQAVDTVQFETDGFSVYGIVGTETLKEHVITADGESFTIEVTYGPDAKIPSGARLEATEVKEGTEEYQKYIDLYKEAYAKENEEELNDEDEDSSAEADSEDDISFARFFDIQILVNETKIEPQAPVQVNIKYDDAIQLAENEQIKAVHFADDGTELIGVDVTGDEKGITDVTFTQGSFSITGTVVQRLATNWPAAGEYVVILQKGNNYYALKNDGEITAVTYVPATGKVTFDDLTSMDQTSGYMWTVSNTTNTARKTLSSGSNYVDPNDSNDAVSTTSRVLRRNNDGNMYYRSGSGSTATDHYLGIDELMLHSVGNAGASDRVAVYFANDFKVDEVPDPTPGGDDVDLGAPATDKTLTPNGDGTSTIALSVTGKSQASHSHSKADILVILDTSGSMNSSDMSTAVSALRSLSQQLMNNNTAEYPDTVRMKLRTFSSHNNLNLAWVTGSGSGSSFNNGYTAFNNEIGQLPNQGNGGTNWEEILQAASSETMRSDAAHYVIFVSDGNPTFHVTNGGWGNWNSTYNAYGSGREEATNVSRCYQMARDDAQAIVDGGSEFYTIGVFGSVDRMKNLTAYAYSGNDSGTYPDGHYQTADNQTELNTAFAKIIDDIQKNFAYQDVVIDDGITNMTTSAMVHGSVRQITYKIIDKDGNDITATEKPKIPDATYNSETNLVEWNMGNYRLLDGATYTISFVVWPSQEAYDLVAELNNHMVSYDSLPADVKAQIQDNGGYYSLKTNTTATVDYSQISTTTVDGVPTEVVTPKDPITIPNPPPLSLVDTTLVLKKEWNDSLSPQELLDLLTQNLEDGIETQVIIRVYETTENGEVLVKTSDAPDGNFVFTPEMEIVGGKVVDAEWPAFELSIAPGVMVSAEKAAITGLDQLGYPTATYNGTTYYLIETGHDYTLEEDEFDYHFETEVKPYHPMVVDGELRNVVFIKNSAGDVTGIEAIDTVNLNSFEVINNLKGGINLFKHVISDEEDETSLIYPDTEFTIHGRLLDSDGNPYTFNQAWDPREDKSEKGPEDDATWQEHQNDPGAFHIFDKDGNRVGYKIHVDNTSDFTLTLKAGEYIRFINMPSGTTWEFSEINIPSGYQLSDVWSHGMTGTVEANTANDCEFFNYQNTAEVELYKYIEGTGTHGEDGTWTTMPTPLDDVIFELYGAAEDGSKGDLIKTLDPTEDGLVSLGELPVGNTYYLTEKRTIPGYNLLTYDVKLVITADGADYYLQPDKPVQKAVREVKDDKIVTTIYVPNSSGYELPHTGGSGTFLYTLSGLMLIIASALMYGFRMRRRERRLN